MREVNTADLLANPVVNGRPNTTVEVDESLFIRRKISGVSVTTARGICRKHMSVLCILFQTVGLQSYS